MSVQLGSAYGEIVIGTGNAERSVSSLANSMRRVGGAMSVAITAPLLLIGKSALSATGKFEQALNTMQVVSGATAEQMSALSDTALQLGKDTSFSAGEAAAGMLELAKAGMNADEVTAAIAGTLDLAAAGGLGVAQAAEISANALNAFSLPASDAGRVADILAASANASSIEVTDMALSFQMASSVFASNGQSIEDLSTAVALLGNNGLKASDAGTSLKTMLMRLTAPGDAAKSTLDDLGVAVYNADGSMRSFEDIVFSLQDATAGLTDAQRNQALTTIFGADAIRAANILINEGADSWKEMETAVSKSGAAQEVADAKMKGLSGAIAYAKGTIESALIAAFLPFTDALSNTIRYVADLIGKFTDLPAGVQRAAIVFAALVAAIGPIMLALPMLAGLLGALLSPVALIGIAIAALAAAWVGNFGDIQGKTQSAINAIMPYLDMVRAWVAERLPVALAYLQSIWASSIETMQSVWAALVAFFTPTIERIKTAFGEMINEFAGMGPQMVALWTAVQPILKALATLIGVAVVGAVYLLSNAFAAAMPMVSGLVSAAIDIITIAFTFMTDLFNDTVALVFALIQGDWAGAWDAAGNLVSDSVSFIIDAFNVLLSVGQTILTGVLDFVVGTLNDIKDFIASLDLPNPFAYWEGVLNTIGGLIDGLSGKLTTFKNWLNNFSIPNPFAGWSMPEMPAWMSNLPGFALGTNYAPGGMAIVGERGPELVNLPKGAQVHPANSAETQNALRGGGGSGITNIYNLVANYGYQSPGSLADDVTLLQMMAGA